MVSPTASLPLPMSSPESDAAAASSLTPPREGQKTVSFASHLDQHRPRIGSQRADTPEARLPDRPDAPQETPQASAQAQNEDTAPGLADANRDETASQSDVRGAHPQTPALPSGSPPAFSLAALAVTTGIAPTPLSPLPNPASAASTTPAIPALPPVIPTIPPGSALLPGPALTSTFPALSGGGNNMAGAANATPVNAAPAIGMGNPPLNTPLPSPGVPMDSRAAVTTAAPGVDNALPSVNPLSASASRLAPIVLNPGAPDSIVPNTAEGGQNTASVVNVVAASTPLLAVDTPVVPGISVPQPKTTTGVISTPVGENVKMGENVKSAGVNNANASRANTNEAETGAAKLSAPAVKEHNLDGIERMLTLGTVPTEAPTPKTEAPTPKAVFPSGDTETAAPPSGLDTLPANSVPQPALADIHSHTPTASRNGLPAMPLPPAPGVGTPAAVGNAGTPLSGALTGGLNESVKPGVLTVAAQIGSLLPAAHSANTGAQPAANNANVSGRVFGESLLTSAVHATSAETTTDDQAQAESQNQPHGDEATADPGASNASQPGAAAPLPFSRAAGETSSAAQTASATGSGSADRAHVIDQVSRHLESMRLTDGNGEIRLRLTPRNLGSVQVTVATHQDGVIARIAVETAQVQQVMEGAKEHLRATLESRGLRVSAVEVTVSSTPSGEGNAAFMGQRNWQQAFSSERAEWPSGYGRPPASRQAAPETTSPVPVTAPAASLSASRLDYRA